MNEEERRCRSHQEPGADSLQQTLGVPTGITAALAGDTSATVQLRASDAGCLSVSLTDVSRADADSFKARN